MQGWDYLVVHLHGQQSPGCRVVALNDEELVNWGKGPPLHEYLNKLGADGWELTSQLGDGYGLIFKRPRE